MPIPRTVSVVLLDIEGTTTPISFVASTLFPYARARLASYLEANLQSPELQADLTRLAAERGGETAPDLPLWRKEAPLDSALNYLVWLMDRDRKSAVLKSIQGKIWQYGYEAGELSSQVYADVPPFLRRWRATGRRAFVYSSGSVLAQQLLFRHSEHGDLTPLLDGYFDTGVGPKREPESYRAIAARIGVAPAQILFVSDVPEELVAATTAGLQALLSVRPGNPPPAPHPYVPISDFFSIFDFAGL